MKIRRAQEKDLRTVDRLLSQVLELHAAIRPDLFRPGTRKYTDDELLEIFQDERRPVFVYEDESGQVLGYCFCILQKPAFQTNMVPVRTLYIDDLCVDEKSRGKHVGRALYEYVLNFAKEAGCHNVTLHVWEGNDSARAFYEKVGFGIQQTTMEKILD